MKIFATIITANYFPRAVALYKSLQKSNPDFQLQVLIADNKPVHETIPTEFENIIITEVSSLGNYSLTNQLYDKFALTNIDFFRWSLKPIFTSYLLDQGIEKILYTDCDFYFTGDCAFLFAELDHHPMVLFPHWWNKDPLVDSKSFFALFRSGIYMAGCFLVSSKATHILKWWAEACHYLMGEHPSLGIHDDQRYLDIVPAYYPDTKINEHRGCGIGAWQGAECRRELVNGEVLIKGEYPVIFIHVDDMMVTQIIKGFDPYLLPYLKQYEILYSEPGQKLDNFLPEYATLAEISSITRFKWTVRIRTRIKSMLFKLAKSI